MLTSCRLPLVHAWLGVVLCWLSLAPAWAGALQTLRFDHWGAEQGLADEAVVSALQDSRGLMWLGTTDGLLRHDGRRARVFSADPTDAATLSHVLVYALLEAPAGTLWVGTGAGLDQIDLATDTLRRHALPASLPPQQRRVQALLAGREGRLWVAATGGLFSFEPATGRFTPMVLPPGPGGAAEPLRAMIADGEEGLWLALGARLLRLGPDGRPRQQWPLVPAPDGTAPAVRSLALDGQGRLWVGTHAGVQLIDARSGEASDLPRRLGLPGDTIYALRRDAEQSIWIGSGSQGLWRWRAGALAAEHFGHHAAMPRSLSHDGVASIYQDRSGVLWVGTWGGGLNLADLGSAGFRSYLAVPGEPRSLSHPLVQAVLPDGAWHAWVGTFGGGLNRLHLPSGAVERLSPAQLPITHIKALLQQPGKGLWVGGEGGLWLLELPGRRARRIELGTSAPAGLSISAMLLDAQGRLWAASAAGLHRLSPDGGLRTFRSSSAAPALSHDTIDCLLQDREGRLWVGSKGGLQLWDEQREGFVQPLQADAEMPTPQELMVQSLRQDGAGRLWLGTQLGLYQLVEAGGGGWRLQSWRGVAGMPKGWVNNLETAADGSLWMSSPQGLLRLAPEQARARLYPSRSGRFDGAFNFGASARGDDGSLFYGARGLLHFHPETLRDNPTAPEVLLSDLRVFNRSLLAEPRPGEAAPLRLQTPLAELRELTLSHREAMLSFELSALHFYQHGLARYAWRLEGFDQDWIEGAAGEGLATYTNLDPGRYRLYAKAASPDGVWGPERLLLSLEMTPPWWRHAGFRVGLVLLLLSVLALAWRLRLRALRAAQLRLEREVAQRTAEVEQEKRGAERARHNIALLSEIGRQITASLDAEAISQTLYRHVETLMDAGAFGIGLVRWDERRIDFDFVMQRGERFKPYQRSLDAAEQPATQCVLGARELRIGDLDRDNRELDAVTRQRVGQQRLQLESGAEPGQARSALYVPMLLKQQVVGVVSVLSERADAYTETDLDMLRTLGAYAAVALDNAEAYRRLQLTQTMLVQQEKLASLGALVAGVAHELNTPIGNSLLVASTLDDNSRRFAEQAGNGTLRRSELERFCASTQESAGLLVRSLDSAARLVASFKQLAVDQTSDQRRRFELRRVCEEVALTLANRLRRDEHQLRLEVPEGLVMDSYPGPLGQVLSNLVLNALLHGFGERPGGLMVLQAELQASAQLRLRFSDNGAGIAPEHLGRVFDPFFTTKLGSGGSGLGLHICYTIVHSLLGGQISVRSEAGQGCCFELLLPLVAPKSAD
ncbi:two-component regulator propeller domain-containing protein [Paucibacter sp. M5-1]|uniref:two-component regulator propeller domain-containing protein n=1 Tax=Paucibacter sp. M5-1 TaxID=3015998 RepID=UPI0022B8BC50|nr:two-component regulator propeller domain-containing protein [Paucibacter sp. M5-1]MCZ7881304.1 ATP-binding protein [Paucibacter sp. M5-1]